MLALIVTTLEEGDVLEAHVAECPCQVLYVECENHVAAQDSLTTSGGLDG